MVDHPQSVASAVGKTGCYFLSILHLAEGTGMTHPDALLEYANEVAAGVLGADCTVLDAGQIMSHQTGMRWTCIKAGPGHPLPLEYRCALGELEILRYERPIEPGDTNATERAHFVVGDGLGRPEWDPWAGSHTVAVGHVVSKRIFRRV